MKEISSVIEQPLYKVEMDLPEPYRLALGDIEEVSREIETPYAVVGSLALAVYQGKEWNLNPKRLFPSDIDIFVLADDDKQHMFEQGVENHFGVRRMASEEIARVDFAANFRIVGFHLDAPYLRYDGERKYLDIDSMVFNPIKVDLGKVVVPVLHPQTHLCMVSEKTAFQKYALNLDPEMGERVDTFKEALEIEVNENKMGFPRIDENEFRVYRKFIRSFG